jgi:PAS domain S-box-containing protein
LTALPTSAREQNASPSYAEQQIQNLFMQAPFAIQIVRGPDFIYELANKRSLEIMGLSAHEVIGRSVLDVVPEVKDTLYKLLQQVYITGERYVAEEEAVSYCRNGEKVDIFAKFLYEPLRDEHGTITGIIITGHDITAEVEARNKIKESEEKYKQLTATFEEQIGQRTTELLDTQNFLQQLIDASVEFVCVLDNNLRFITVNRKYEGALNTTRDELKGRSIFEISPIAENTIQHESMLKALNGETVYLDKRQALARPDYFVDTYFIPLLLKQQVEGVIIMSRDITDLVRSEKVLENKNRELNEAQQIAQLGSWEWDVNSGEVGWSEQMFRIYGYEPGSLMNFEKAIERMPEEYAERARSRMKEHLHDALRLFKETGQTVYHNPASEFPIILPDGTKKYLRGAGKIILTAEGKVSRVIGTVQDITEQKNSERKIIEANEQLEQRNQFVEKLIHSSLDLIMVVDRDLRFIKLNKKAESVIRNYYPGELIGKKITEVNLSIEDTEPYNDLLKAFDGKIIIRDQVRSTISGNYYEHNYVPLSDATGVYAVMIISHDITESIRQTEELRKAIEADKLKSDFIKMASHELKTPITSIKGYVQLLLTVLKENQQEEKKLSPLLLRSSLGSIEKQLNRLTRLLTELLDLSRIESGQLELNMEEFGINELAIDVVQDVIYTKPRQQIHLYHDLTCKVNGDKDRIGQVIINLLTNAIKYSPHADKIDITIDRHEAEYVAIKVRDYGIGIDKKFHEKIFDRFFRAEGHEEQTYPGFGIGLFIAKEIIQRHGGSIFVASEKKNGSVFTFTLPVAKKNKG